MNIIISNSSMVPIYEQIVDQIKNAILHGDIKGQEALPSVRTLSKVLKISALTVKKAYDHLEADGFIITVHGKGSFIADTNEELLMETKRKEVETDLEMAIQKGRHCGLSDQEIQEMITLIMED